MSVQENKEFKLLDADLETIDKIFEIFKISGTHIFKVKGKSEEESYEQIVRQFKMYFELAEIHTADKYNLAYKIEEKIYASSATSLLHNNEIKKTQSEYDKLKKEYGLNIFLNKSKRDKLNKIKNKIIELTNLRNASLYEFKDANNQRKEHFNSGTLATLFKKDSKSHNEWIYVYETPNDNLICKITKTLPKPLNLSLYNYILVPIICYEPISNNNINFSKDKRFRPFSINSKEPLSIRELKEKIYIDINQDNNNSYEISLYPYLNDRSNIKRNIYDMWLKYDKIFPFFSDDNTVILGINYTKKETISNTKDKIIKSLLERIKILEKGHLELKQTIATLIKSNNNHN